MSSCLPRIVPCNFCTFKQNSHTECRKYFAVCCLQNSEQRMLHQGHISSAGARFLNHSWFWVIPNKIFSPHQKSWLILCFFLSLTNIFTSLSERKQDWRPKQKWQLRIRLERKQQNIRTSASSSSSLLLLLSTWCQTYPTFLAQGVFGVIGSFGTPLWNY